MRDLETAPTPAETLDLGWMEQPGEWGTRATPSKQGLTLADIQIGSYAEPGTHSDNQTGRPRGAVGREGAYRIGAYSVDCEYCGADAHRIISRSSIHLSAASKVARLDPKYDKMVDQAMKNTQNAEPDHLLKRTKPFSDKS